MWQKIHFRFRNNLIQVIRTTYDPATKGPRTEIVGRLSRGEPVLGEDLRAACSAAEIAEVQSWIASSLRARAVAAEHAARTLPEQMERAGEWFASTPDRDSARVVAVEVQRQWARLRNQMRREGLTE
ncbi:MAG: hypothetical protein HYZ20_11495 [Burkholderiales bacterium]|nr:hypothetical protein [Burkholderiales bacterium]